MKKKQDTTVTMGDNVRSNGRGSDRDTVVYEQEPIKAHGHSYVLLGLFRLRLQ